MIPFQLDPTDDNVVRIQWDVPENFVIKRCYWTEEEANRWVFEREIHLQWPLQSGMVDFTSVIPKNTKKGQKFRIQCNLLHRKRGFERIWITSSIQRPSHALEILSPVLSRDAQENKTKSANPQSIDPNAARLPKPNGTLGDDARARGCIRCDSVLRNGEEEQVVTGDLDKSISRKADQTMHHSTNILIC